MWGGFKRRGWILLFFVVIWSVWCLRNNIIFEKKVAEWNAFLEVIKQRWQSWGMEGCDKDGAKQSAVEQ